MSAIENAAGKILVRTHGQVTINLSNHAQEMPNVSPSAIRLDVLVELMRGKSKLTSMSMFPNTSGTSHRQSSNLPSSTLTSGKLGALGP